MKLTLEHLDYCAKYRAECYGEDLEISKEKLRRKISKGKINLLWPGKGYIILRDDYDNPGYAHISAILVEKKHQGKGYGTLILKRAEEEAKKGRIPGLSKERFLGRPGLVADELLGLMIADYIAGVRGIFEFIRFDQAKPGILKKLGPISNDAIGGLIAGVSSNMYTKALAKARKVR